MLFVYGTLQDADILHAVLSRHISHTQLRPAEAPGYRVVHYPGRAYPALIPHPGGTASGLVIEELSPVDLCALDAYEGDEYHRKTIAVLVQARERLADTYLPAMPIAHDSPAWALQHWTDQHKHLALESERTAAQAQRQRCAGLKGADR